MLFDDQRLSIATMLYLSLHLFLAMAKSVFTVAESCASSKNHVNVNAVILLGFFLLLSSMAVIDSVYAEQETQILITGETNPKVSLTSNPYEYRVEIIGDIQNSGKLERCFGGNPDFCVLSRILEGGDDRVFYHHFDGAWLLSNDFLQSKETIMYKNGKAVGSLDIFPVVISQSVRVDPDLREKLSNSSIDILEYHEQYDSSYVVLFELCPGSQSVTSPEIFIKSDRGVQSYTLDFMRNRP